MEEILSIVEKERFADCPLCNTPVSSNSPICKKCGLEMSSEGIIEMAEDKESIEPVDNIDFSDIYNLRNLAFLSLAYNIFGYIFYLGLELPFFFKIYFWIGLFFYYSAYTSWNKKFSKQTLSYEDAVIVKKEKTISLLIFLCSTLIGATIYIFLLK